MHREILDRRKCGYVSCVRRKIRAKAKARLTRVAKPIPAADRQQWVRELRALRNTQGTKKPRLSVETILAEDREDRA